MPNREVFVIGDVYHIVNRGVDRRQIFCDESDYLRFTFTLAEFNSWEVIYNFSRLIGFGNQSSGITVNRKKQPVVEVLAFTLLPNHYHLLLRPFTEDGIPLFMRKVGIGHANYFNKKYERSGALFQGRYKCKHIDTQEYFEYVVFYVYANILDLIYPEWREGKLENAAAALEYMESYRWSSFADYVGRRNFPSVTQRGYLQERLTGGPDEYRRRFINWLRDFQDNREMMKEFEA